MQKKEFLKLVDKYLEGKASPEEEQLLQNFYDSFDTSKEWDRKILGAKAELETKLFDRIQTAIHRPSNNKSIKFIVLKRVAIAAAIILICTVGLLIFTQHKQQENVANHPLSVANKISPGKNQAILKLADGKQIVLESAFQGEIAQQNDIHIWQQNGELIYKEASTDAALNEKNSFNTITTPSGGQYQVNLPDGSKVWLNAASSLTYPTNFKGAKKREVILNGEAYFEVAKKEAQPFTVKSKNQVVEVLGTHFNINAYDDEPTIKTTLLEGKVKVSQNTNTNEGILLPGQQALGKTNVLTIKNVDAEEFVAWKNGLLRFDSQPLESVMRQISRWYDVKIEYKDQIGNKTFSGTISRYAEVEDVLQILELTGRIHFKIDGRRVIVMQ